MNPALLLTIASAIGGTLAKVLASLGASLLTEAVVKRLIILTLEKVAAKTETDVDNQVLAICKEAWEPKAPTEQEK